MEDESVCAFQGFFSLCMLSCMKAFEPCIGSKSYGDLRLCHSPRIIVHE